MQNLNINQAEIETSLNFHRQQPYRFPSYSLKLPNWDAKQHDSGLHIGAPVKSVINGNVYVLVQFVDDMAVVVPLNCPVCGYLTPCSNLEKVNIMQPTD